LPSGAAAARFGYPTRRPEESSPTSIVYGRYILGPRALRILHEVELHPLALGQRFEPRSADGGVVNEYVLAAAVGLDETEALVVHEPLHCPSLACHAPPRCTGDRMRVRPALEASAARIMLRLRPACDLQQERDRFPASELRRARRSFPRTATPHRLRNRGMLD